MASGEQGNILLQSLPPEILAAVLLKSDLVHYDMREYLLDGCQPIKFVDFPESGVLSLLSKMEDGTLIELATIGREGMVGVSVALGVSNAPDIVFCQVESTSRRIESKEFQGLQRKYPLLAELCQRYAVSLFSQVASTTGCNRTHSIQQRCARWMLHTLDRCDGNRFPLTQEFLAAMLGVSRTGVNLAAGILAKAKTITYVRGRVTVLDRKGLEAACCPCYVNMLIKCSSIMATVVEATV